MDKAMLRNLLAAVTIVAATPLHAANITPYRNCPYGYPDCIVINGEFDIFDFAKFSDARKAVSPEQFQEKHGGYMFPKVAVYLNSPGGIIAGTQYMATMFNGAVTVVPENAVCASMCSYLWMMGRRRFLAPTGRVGFHSASTRDGEASKLGNERLKEGFEMINMFGWHNQLSTKAIEFLFSTNPYGMLWLTPQLANKVGIDYESWPADAHAPPRFTEREVCESQGLRWHVPGIHDRFDAYCERTPTTEKQACEAQGFQWRGLGVESYCKH
jgi:hypothetical protein